MEKTLDWNEPIQFSNGEKILSQRLVEADRNGMTRLIMGERRQYWMRMEDGTSKGFDSPAGDVVNVRPFVRWSEVPEAPEGKNVVLGYVDGQYVWREIESCEPKEEATAAPETAAEEPLTVELAVATENGCRYLAVKQGRLIEIKIGEVSIDWYDTEEEAIEDGMTFSDWEKHEVGKPMAERKVILECCDAEYNGENCLAIRIPGTTYVHVLTMDRRVRSFRNVLSAVRNGGVQFGGEFTPLYF